MKMGALKSKVEAEERGSLILSTGLDVREPESDRANRLKWGSRAGRNTAETVEMLTVFR